MKIGETKTVTLPPEEAFGLRNEDLVIEINKDALPSDITPEVGIKLQLTQPEGDPIVATITSLNENSITLDANHPLAGYKLLLDIELIEIV